jgi:outer membrane protein TolC
MNKYFQVIAFLAVTQSAWGFAQTPLTPEEAVRTALKNSPQAKVVELNIERADLLIEQEENRYIPVWTTDGGIRYGRSVSLSPSGTRFVESNSIVLATGLAHTLPVGTQLRVEFEVGRTYRDSVELGDLGAAYDTALTFGVTQPLLRGFGKDVGQAQLKLAKTARKSVDAEQNALVSGIILDAVNAYWSLWSAQRGLEIQQAALEIAKKQLEEGEIRLEAGALAPAQIVPLRIQVARSEEAVVAARATIRQRSVALADTLGIPPSETILTSNQPPSWTPAPTMDEAYQKAVENSPTMARLKTSVESTRIQVHLATNAALPRLDAIANLNLGGLGTTPGDSFSSIATADGIVVYGGLRLELPIINRARKIDVERSEAQSLIAETELTIAERNLRTQIANLLVDLETAQERLALSKQTAALTRENVDAQTARFEAGKGTMLEVVDALESVREAEFNVVQIEVTIAQQRLKIDEITGRLLEEWQARR